MVPAPESWVIVATVCQVDPSQEVSTVASRVGLVPSAAVSSKTAWKGWVASEVSSLRPRIFHDVPSVATVTALVRASRVWVERQSIGDSSVQTRRRR